ncbi:hypothetical protein MUK42_30047 [Musa troglodytarum]|uniref:Uncharacterized protein n=1 Tax=Musa troglodytarum TaxID=320322 RepID=A0A9E7F6C6_9LILI|nr:hypothetical protein MUK42_30047 [Musa troglodytarum]
MSALMMTPPPESRLDWRRVERRVESSGLSAVGADVTRLPRLEFRQRMFAARRASRSGLDVATLACRTFGRKTNRSAKQRLVKLMFSAMSGLMIPGIYGVVSNVDVHTQPSQSKLQSLVASNF